MANFRIEKAAFDSIAKSSKMAGQDLKQFNSRLNKELPKKIIKMLRKMTPKDTGDTSEAWTVKRNGNSGFTILNKRGAIVEFLIEGVKPHVIEPKDKSVLKMKIGTSVIYSKIVNHPGFGSQINKTSMDKKLVDLVMKETEKITTDILIKRFK